MKRNLRKKRPNKTNHKTLIVNASLIVVIMISTFLMFFYQSTMAVPDIPTTIRVENIHRVHDPFQPNYEETVGMQGIAGTETIVYCYNISKQTMHHAESMVLSGEITDPGLVYIIENGYPNKMPMADGDKFDNYFVTQWTLWAYKSMYYNEPLEHGNSSVEQLRTSYGAYSAALSTLLDGAIAARSNGTSTDPNLSFGSSITMSATMINNAYYYISSPITVNATIPTTYKLSVSAPSGYYLVDSNNQKVDVNSTFNTGSSFRIVVPASSIESNNMTINLKANATFSGNKLRLYTPSPADPTVQDGLLAVLYPTDTQKEITASVTIPKAKLKVIKTSVDEQGKTEYVKGATLRISSTDDSSFSPQEWVTDGTPKEFTDLIPGKTYTVTEVKPANGYINNATPKSYTLTAADSYTSGNNIATIEMENEYTKLEVGKLDINTGEYIAGATLSITSRDTGQEYMKIITTTKPTVITKIPVDEYVLQEVEAPEGYILNPTKVIFTVTNTGEVQQQFIKNNYTKVSVANQRITVSMPEKGFKLEIRNADGKVVDTFTTTGQPYTTEELPVGKYTIVEIEAAEGYACMPTPIDVYVPAKGTDVPDIIFANDYTKVQISKVDITNEEELPGAELEIRDSEGNVIEKWTSTEAPHQIDRLPVGKYTLVETMAPEGYTLSTTEVEFQVSETGDIQTVTMVNQPEIEVPDTAMDASTITYICGAVILVCGVGLIAYNVIDQKKKKQRKNKKD